MTNTSNKNSKSSSIAIGAIYRTSDDIVSREIEGELIIIPLVSGIGDLEEEMYSLNEIGRFIWNHLDGTSSLQDIIEQLEKEYDTPTEEIQEDVLGLILELEKRKMVIQVHDNS